MDTTQGTGASNKFTRLAKWESWRQYPSHQTNQKLATISQGGVVSKWIMQEPLLYPAGRASYVLPLACRHHLGTSSWSFLRFPQGAVLRGYEYTYFIYRWSKNGNNKSIFICTFLYREPWFPQLQQAKRPYLEGPFTWRSLISDLLLTISDGGAPLFFWVCL